MSSAMIELCPIAMFANGSFTDTFGHIYDPADLSAFLADWNPPERVRAQIGDAGHDIALVRDDAGAILGYIKMGPVEFDLPPEQPTDDAVELHQRAEEQPPGEATAVAGQVPRAGEQVLRPPAPAEQAEKGGPEEVEGEAVDVALGGPEDGEGQHDEGPAGRKPVGCHGVAPAAGCASASAPTGSTCARQIPPE